MVPYLKASFSNDASLLDITNYIYNIIGVLPMDEKTSERVRKELLESIKSESNDINSFINKLQLDENTKKMLKWWIKNLNISECKSEGEIKDCILFTIDKLPISSSIKDKIKNVLDIDYSELIKK